MSKNNMKRLDTIPYKDDSFYNWYYENVRNNADMQDKLVREDLAIALRVFSTFRDIDIGNKIIEAYRDHPQLSHVAHSVTDDIRCWPKHTGLEGGKTIGGKRILYLQPSFFDAIITEKNGFVGDTIHLCGKDTIPPLTNFREENHWDNLLKLIEDAN